MMLTATALSAQNYIIVNSEKIFKSMSEYNTAIASLDKLAQDYQTKVDARFAEVEKLYNTYMQQKASIPAQARDAREQEILDREQEANQYRESIFGREGELMKLRVQKIEPIQKRVFAVIEAYAKKVGADMVMDASNNPTLLYKSETVDKTEEIIQMLK